MMENNEINPYAIQTIASSGKWMRNIAISSLIFIGLSLLFYVYLIVDGGVSELNFGLTPIWMMILVAVFFGIVILFCVLTLNTGRNAMQLELKPNNQTMEKYVTSYLILQYLLLGTSVLVIMISVTTFLKYYL
ncbi:MAG: hypothetical protein IT244_12660 [Bacteroidia bacterium]|nr:hypothetical protein [Bacteroidia bacterium]